MSQVLNFQLKERGYTNIDAIDGSEGMLQKAKEKGVYKNCMRALIGSAPIEGIERGMHNFSSFPSFKDHR